MEYNEPVANRPDDVGAPDRVASVGPRGPGSRAFMRGPGNDVSEVGNPRTGKLARQRALYSDICSNLDLDEGLVSRPFVDLGWDDDCRLIGSEYKPTPEQAATLRDQGIVLVFEKAPRHKHLLASVGRALCEMEMIVLIKQLSHTLGRAVRVVDVGSNARRLHTCLAVHWDDRLAKPEVHHLIPQIEGGDPRRLRSSRDKFNVCTHKLAECDCFSQPDVFLLQQSLYNVGPETLAARLEVGMEAYASMHHCFTAGGSILGGEITWTIQPDGLLAVKAEGNVSAYVHPTNAWLRLGKLTFGHKTLVWDLVASHLETHLYRFWVTPTLPGYVASTHTDQTEDYLRRLQGQLALVAKERATGPSRTDVSVAVDFTVRRVYTRYTEMYFADERKETVMVPLDLIGALRAQAALQARTQMLRSALVASARRLVGSGGWPSDMQPRVILIAVAAALTADVEEETAHLGLLNARYKALNDAHQKALLGAPIKRWGILAAISPWNWWSTCCNVDEHHQPDAQEFHGLAHAGALPEEFRALSLEGLRFKLESEYKSTAELAPTSSFRVLADSTYVEPNQASFKLVLIAMGPMVPVATNQRMDDVIQAFTVRIGRQVPIPEPDAWKEIGQLFFTRGDHADHLSAWVMDEPIDLGPQVVEDWLARLPASAQRVLRIALEDLEKGPITSSDLKAKAFLKLEKSAFAFPGERVVFNPRLVFGYSPKAVAATGPYNWMYAKRVRDRLAVLPGNPVIWVTGSEADGAKFGKWYKAAVDSIPVGNLTLFWWDHRQMEAHRPLDFHELQNALMETGDPTDDYWVVQESRCSIDAFGLKHPIQLRAEGPNGSGGTATSVDSGQRSHATAREACGRFEWSKSMLAFNGDDNLLIIDHTRVHLTVEGLHAAFAKLGHEADIFTSRDPFAVEFCQSLPYPVGDRIVWGPKIGRVLQRLPWALEHAHEDPRGVAKGMLVSCSHIPFLTEYLHHVVEQVPTTVQSIRPEYTLGSREWLRPTAETWAFVNARYGLTEAADLNDFKFLLERAKLGDVVAWRRMSDIVKIDE